MSPRQESYSGLYSVLMLLIVVVCISSALKKAAVSSALVACDAKVQSAVVAKQPIPRCAK